MYILIPLILTILIEEVVMFLTDLLLKERFTARRALYVLLVNAVTNPILNIVIISFHLMRSPIVLLLEVIVVVAEAFLFRILEKRGYSYCFLVAINLNAVSYILGGLLYELIF